MDHSHTLLSIRLKSCTTFVRIILLLSCSDLCLDFGFLQHGVKNLVQHFTFVTPCNCWHFKLFSSQQMIWAFACNSYWSSPVIIRIFMMTKNYGNNFCWPQLAGKKFSPINKGQIGSVTKKWWKFFVNYSCCFAVSWQFHRKSLDSQQNTLIFAKKLCLREVLLSSFTR